MKKSAVTNQLIFKVMRFFTLIYIFLSVMLFAGQASPLKAQELNSRISFSFKHGTLTELLKNIEKKTNLSFVYTNKDAVLNRYVPTVNVDNEMVSTLLQRILTPMQLTYQVQNNQVIIKKAIRVKGRVTDEKGLPVPGVNIIEKGVGNTAVTDFNGEYSLNVQDASSVLLFKMMGYQTQEIAVKGQLPINIKLVPDQTALSEVVVTALGIKRSEKALGYSIATVKGADVSTAPEVNVINSLAGKVAGVNVVSTGSDPGSSAFITIRGQSSIATDNQPLFVVDGVPVAHSLRATSEFGRSSVDYGSPIADISPDDIETITVLKGASAAALYGSRAGSGVILITTKSGAANKKGLGISFNSSAQYDKAYLFPHFQTEFGAGDYTDDPAVSTSSAWGPRLNVGTKHLQWNSPLDANGKPIPTDWVSYPNNVKDFYETGSTYTNNLAITGKNESGNYRLSYTNLKNQGIVPNTDLSRNTLNLAATYVLHPKVKISTNFGYVNNKSDNRPSAYRESVTQMLYSMPPNMNINDLRNYWKPGRENLEQFSPDDSDNPFFVAYQHTNGYDRNRITGNVQAVIDLTNDLSLMARTGLDMYNEQHETKRPFSSKRFKFGGYGVDNSFFKEQNTDFLLSYKKTLNEYWSFSLSAGGNQMDQTGRSTAQRTESLSIPGIYNINNAQAGTITNSQYSSRKRINSLYGMGHAAYKDMVFLDVTGRNDWSSTLPPENNSYFYPSVSFSTVLTDVFKIKSNVLSFVKIRANWAQVGSDTDPYQLYNTVPFNQDWGDVKRATIEFNLKNNFLKPEIATSYEFGGDLRFLDSRLGLDVTWYKTNKRNQIINIPTTIASGASNRLINAGNIQNSGWEIGFFAVPVKTDFKWEMNVNFTKNENKVISLMEGLPEYSMGSADGDNIRYLIKEGTKIGDFYTPSYTKVPTGPNAGAALLDKTGHYIRNNSEYLKVGNYNPDFTVGFNNTFSYKRFTLNVLLDWRKGGNFYSYVVKSLINAGLTDNTLVGRDAQSGGLPWVDSQGRSRNDGMIIPGFIANTDGSYSENKVIIAASDFYNNTYNKYYERLTYSATFLKLREASLTYVFNQQLLKKLPISNLSISLIGRNLYTWTANGLGYDPESTMSVTEGFKLGVGHWTLPGTRSFGFKLSCNF
ncbi:SusC/RagA family TonB-linked outer membrane protein [Pedobacter sp. PACM 27299]|uniref:SusC/RagA family TonB-linked outer membrane protein n=1 Tax=Pedobacter sp. PACM 27299 TaxID=1727164 RepID=UPI000705739A|nr:SusC/RagA family TonB-linked outer membrane protein [Pedobacter sp. PACM 27299]ALL06838.1 SusC/RagA family TonB-linked outer membrane protein [Pedobacter sp. PACM 27299]